MRHPWQVPHRGRTAVRMPMVPVGVRAPVAIGVHVDTDQL